MAAKVRAVAVVPFCSGDGDAQEQHPEKVLFCNLALAMGAATYWLQHLSSAIPCLPITLVSRPVAHLPLPST